MADTLICGGCRFVTCDFEAFKDHRIAGCRSKKEEGEPDRMKCASCDQRFQSAWALMCHLTDFHRMMLYKIETPVKSEPWTPLTGQTIPGLAGLSAMPSQQSYQQISSIGQGIPTLGAGGYGKRM
uniref:C2H2-type domain-containing protein n=1 Tax=Heterorhabditis bacteriophora TaxID=37862 RepID=A0A1I7WZQ8_HETBA